MRDLFYNGNYEYIKHKIFYFDEKDSLSYILKNIEKRSIAFCNGCFDILHTGHLTMLSKASEIADILVVGLNSDLSVKQYKSDKRPINNEDQRAFNLASLFFVDYVIIFEDLNPVSIIDSLKPNYFVKGSDWTIDKILPEERELLTKHDIQLINLESVEGMSTTNTINKILEVYKNDDKTNRS